MNGFGKIATISSNGNTDFEWNGGEGVFLASGTFGASTTIKLQQKIGSAFVDLADGSLAASGGFKFVTIPTTLRVVVANISGNLSLNVQSLEK